MLVKQLQLLFWGIFYTFSAQAQDTLLWKFLTKGKVNSSPAIQADLRFLFHYIFIIIRSLTPFEYYSVCKVLHAL